MTAVFAVHLPGCPVFIYLFGLSFKLSILSIISIEWSYENLAFVVIFDVIFWYTQKQTSADCIGLTFNFDSTHGSCQQYIDKWISHHIPLDHQRRSIQVDDGAHTY